MTEVSAKYAAQRNESTLNLKTADKESKYSGFNKGKVIIAVVSVVILAVIIAVVFALKKGDDGKTGQNEIKKSFTLLISLDGFRAEYLTRGITPNLDKIAADGVKADFMRPSFPTKTFTNHYTIVTGLYPESNGMVENSFYDPDLNDSFKIGPKAGESEWWKGEPIWVTAIKNGMKSASFYWVGSEAEIQGIRPTYWRIYDASIPWEVRIQQVIQWIQLPADERPRMITMYFEEPDKKGHKYGPTSPEVTRMIKMVDDTMGILLKEIEEKDLKNKINMVVVSDHGMAEIDCNKNITLGDKANLTEVMYKGLGPFSLLYTKNDNQTREVYKDLRCSTKDMNIYTKHNHFTPKRYHYTNSKRIGDIVVAPNISWSVIKKNGKCYPNRGTHGYDNLEEDMKAIFMATGPAFKKNYKFEQLPNLEIYSLLTDLLHIPAAPNNGTYGSLHHLLTKEFLQTLKPKPEEKLYDITPRGFPDDFDKALSECKFCICTYCNRNISSNSTFYRKKLNLTEAEVLSSHKTHAPWGLPKSESKTSDLLLTQTHYITGYSPKLHIPMWVAYKLTRKQLEDNVPRSNCFRKDIRLHEDETAFCSSYTRSGFDRGHMAPSADFNFNVESEQDTFVLSNIVPQYPNFNRYGPTSLQ